MKLNKKQIDQVKLSEAMDDAIASLRGSERGRRVLRDLKALYKNGGYGLDSTNMTALCILVEAVRVGRGGYLQDSLSSL